MLNITSRTQMPGEKWFILVEERTGLKGIGDTDPVTGKTGVRTGAFIVRDSWLKDADLTNLVLHVTLSHEGNEEDRLRYPNGDWYVDEFGMYVYSTSEMASKIKGRKTYDNRYDKRLELPRPMDGPWDDNLPAGDPADGRSGLYRL